MSRPHPRQSTNQGRVILVAVELRGIEKELFRQRVPHSERDVVGSGAFVDVARSNVWQNEDLLGGYTVGFDYLLSSNARIHEDAFRPPACLRKMKLPRSVF